jgi:glyoxylase-like metal-dependent hydrolase (beta-lactamase superfamily II)
MTTNNCNTYLIDGPTRILVDPGHAALFDHVATGLKNLNLGMSDMGLVLCTHAHPDHIEAVELLRKQGILFALHKDEWSFVRTFQKRYPNMGIAFEHWTPDFLMTEGALHINGIDLEIYHTPGHSPGAVCIYWPHAKALFSGDLVFKDGLGRTDLPGGDGSQLKQSIQRMAELDIEWILPGHGPWIQGRREVQENFKRLEHAYFAYI